MDIVLALALLIVLAPVLLAIAVCVACSSGFPVIYRQRRIGRAGKPFTFFKFRSMCRDADRVLDQHLRASAAARTEWGDFQNLNSDPRVTRVGAMLRRLSLDELPQLWNVLRGDMSLVGPRPCMERQVSLHADGWAHYCAMRPGMSGLWQVSGRNRLTYRERVALDIDYVERWSLGLDLLILVRTSRAVLAGGG
jgi:lipopolysaccharide/colanic/teichoic acid biosynthesis glycosyltransferase